MNVSSGWYKLVSLPVPTPKTSISVPMTGGSGYLGGKMLHSWQNCAWSWEHTLGILGSWILLIFGSIFLPTPLKTAEALSYKGRDCHNKLHCTNFDVFVSVNLYLSFPKLTASKVFSSSSFFFRRTFKMSLSAMNLQFRANYFNSTLIFFFSPVSLSFTGYFILTSITLV